MIKRDGSIISLMPKNRASRKTRQTKILIVSEVMSLQ